jgi:hypothetical protein
VKYLYEAVRHRGGRAYAYDHSGPMRCKADECDRTIPPGEPFTKTSPSAAPTCRECEPFSEQLDLIGDRKSRAPGRRRRSAPRTYTDRAGVRHRADECDSCRGRGWFRVDRQNLSARTSCPPCQGTGFIHVRIEEGVSP